MRDYADRRMVGGVETFLPSSGPRRSKSTGSTTLYRLFNSEGHLLYIGITDNPRRRLQSHARARPRMWERAATVTLVHYLTRQEAADAESRAIHVEAPEFNKQFNGG